ncbi:MAG: DUF2116 family Zn-ribbon domain-containing protein [Thaumarchaeota archaeon]|nr:DUF2116 family Zn-ribbon domain-containing protein [Nitrososphaerota archaeon]
MPKKERESFDVPPHTHCKVCGRPIPLGQVYCSRECAEKDRREQRRSMTMFAVYMGVVAIIFIVMMLLTQHLR